MEAADVEQRLSAPPHMAPFKEGDHVLVDVSISDGKVGVAISRCGSRGGEGWRVGRKGGLGGGRCEICDGEKHGQRSVAAASAYACQGCIAHSTSLQRDQPGALPGGGGHDAGRLRASELC